MSTSPVSPEDIRAAAELHHELGPEYSDAVVAAFLDKVDREVAARVEARLAEASRSRMVKRGGRRTLVTGVAIGACAGALITGITVAHLDSASAGSSGTRVSYSLPGRPPGQGPRGRLLPYVRNGKIVLPQNGPTSQAPVAPAK